MELDFLRHSQLFRDNGPPADQRIAMITDFVAEVRKALDGKKGKRRWLGVRIPLDGSAHPPLGLDVRKLYAAGVDMFNLSGWYNTTQHTDAAKVRELVPHAAIYVEMTHTTGRNRHFHTRDHAYGTSPFPRTSDRQFYTTARLAYERGADGVSLFNFVYYRMIRKGVVDYREPPFHVLPKLTDREFLATQPPYYWLGDTRYDRHDDRQIPRTLRKGRSERFRMDMLPVENAARLRLRIHAREGVADRQISAAVNGLKLTPTADVSAFYDNPFDRMVSPDDKHRRAWTIPAERIRDGINEISLKLESGHSLKVVWIDVGV